MTTREAGSIQYMVRLVERDGITATNSFTKKNLGVNYFIEVVGVSIY